MNFKLDFKDSEKIEKFHSQAGQDIFVLSCLDGKKSGIFLDLGCRHPIDINNTYLLEEKYNWNGVSVDIEKDMIDLFYLRNSKALCKDATKLNFEEIITVAGTTHFDYLSLDLEPASITEQCLLSIPFNKISFSVITYEHDSYRFGEKYKYSSREIFEKNGYKRICSDVCNSANPYEDWYFNPKYVSYERIQVLESNFKEWKDILF